MVDEEVEETPKQRPKRDKSFPSNSDDGDGPIVPAGFPAPPAVEEQQPSLETEDEEDDDEGDEDGDGESLFGGEGE